MGRPRVSSGCSLASPLPPGLPSALSAFCARVPGYPLAGRGRAVNSRLDTRRLKRDTAMALKHPDILASAGRRDVGGPRFMVGERRLMLVKDWGMLVSVGFPQPAWPSTSTSTSIRIRTTAEDEVEDQDEHDQGKDRTALPGGISPICFFWRMGGRRVSAVSVG